MPKQSSVEERLAADIKKSFKGRRQKKMLAALRSGKLGKTKIHQRIERQKERENGLDSEAHSVEAVIAEELGEIDAEISSLHKKYEQDLLVLQKRRRVVEQCQLSDG